MAVTAEWAGGCFLVSEFVGSKPTDDMNVRSHSGSAVSSRSQSYLLKVDRSSKQTIQSNVP